MAVELGSVAPVGFDDFADPAWLGCMREIGCRNVQVYRNRHGNIAGHAKPVSLQQIRDYVAAGQMPCDSLHGMYGNDIDPSSPDERARQAAVDTFKAEGDLALQLGGPLVVVHCAGIVEVPVGPDEKKIRYRQLHKSIEDLGRFGQAQGVCYAFENLPPYHAVGSDVVELTGLLNEMNSSQVGMCFDIAHANLAGDAIAAARAAADQMRYIHICDNHGQADEHLMPFCGNIDWDAFAATLRDNAYDGVLMLEVFDSLDGIRRQIDEGLHQKLAAFLATAGAKE